MSAEAEIGSERDQELNALRDVFSSRGYGSRSCQRCDSWYRGFRRLEHHNGLCAGDSERTPPNLKHFESPVSEFLIYLIIRGPIWKSKAF
jgi:hypothetical protein